MSQVNFNGSNWDEFKLDFAAIALNRGKVGLDFIRIRCLSSNGSNSKEPCSYTPIPVDIMKTSEENDEGQKLLSDMIRSITAGVYKRLKEGSKEKLTEAICNVDYNMLWDELEKISEHWKEGTKAIDDKIRDERSKYGPIYGVIDMLRGTYVVESWKRNTDPMDLQSDIVLMTANLALGDDM